MHQRISLHTIQKKCYKHSLTLTFLLNETHVGLTTLCGINFQCMVPTWISSNKRVDVRENGKKRVFIALLYNTIR